MRTPGPSVQQALKVAVVDNRVACGSPAGRR
jgi:hypothetical protein